MRGPSGRGASQAEEKARAGVLAKSPPLPLGSRNKAFPVHWPSEISSGVNQPPDMVFTNHETRNTNHGLLSRASTVGWREMQAGLSQTTRHCFQRFHESRNTAFLDSSAVRHLYWSESGPANGFSRITNHGHCLARGRKPARIPRFSRNTNHETRITAFMVPVGTEALQSCFFCPGMLGNPTGRRSP